MSNPTKIYNDYVRANLPNTMTFNSSTARYNINNHSFFSFNRANWYFKYITKFGYASLSVYAVNNFDPDLVFDFKQNYYRTGGTETTLSPAVTHARAGNATMVDSDGLLKWAPHNLLIRSEELNLWSQQGTGSAVVNNAVAPDGTTTAATFTIGSTNFQRYILSSGAYTAGDKITYSFWARSDTVTTLPLGINGGTNGANNNIFSSIAVTSTWNLVEFEFTVTGDDSSLYYIIGKQSQNPVNCQLGDVEIWHPHVYHSDLGGMVNNSATGNSYVPTTSSAVYLPRVGHHVYNGSAWVNEGVLHESEARTNLMTYSEDFSDSSWTKTSCVVTANVVVAPDGSTTADEVIPDTTGLSVNRIALFSSLVHTASVWVKDAGRGACFVSMGGNTKGYLINVDLTDGSYISGRSYGGGVLNGYSITSGGNGWYRVSVSASNSAPDGHVGLFIGGGDGVSSASGIYIWGAQVEAGSTPSSYIPTSGSTVTRAAETLTVPAANLPYSSTNMSIQMDGRMTYADEDVSGQLKFFRWFKDNNNEIRVLYDTHSSYGTGRITFQQIQGGNFRIVNSGSNTYPEGLSVPFNIASRHGSSFVNGAISGTALTVITTPVALPDLSTSTLSLGNTFMGTIGKFRVWDEDLTDTGIAEAST